MILRFCSNEQLRLEPTKESMAQCPMMKDMDEKSGGDHNGHQKE
jgi:hypothetical protein